MANINAVYQQQNTVSIPRDALKNIAEDDQLSKTDLRVFMALFTELNGFTDIYGRKEDPKNFKLIDLDSIADFLYLKHKDVKKSIKNLKKSGYIEQGNSESISNGWRFTF